MLLLQFDLEGTEPTIHTDHASLKLILNSSDAIGLMAGRWLRLFEFDFNIINRVGIEKQAAEQLSRLDTGGENYMISTMTLSLLLYTSMRTRAKQTECQNIKYDKCVPEKNTNPAQ